MLHYKKNVYRPVQSSNHPTNFRANHQSILLHIYFFDQMCVVVQEFDLAILKKSAKEKLDTYLDYQNTGLLYCYYNDSHRSSRDCSLNAFQQSGC